MAAVCVDCGVLRAERTQACPGCGAVALGEARLLAWLLSSENLPNDQLDAAAERIQRGEDLQPSKDALLRARHTLGWTLKGDPGLSVRAGLGLLAMSLLLTPLPGLVLGAAWRMQHPRRSIQAFALTIPLLCVEVFVVGRLVWFA